MSKIIIATEKNNISEIEALLKVLTPNVRADFIDANLAKSKDYLIFNFDNLELRKACELSEAEKISFGFSDQADFYASDQMKTEDGISFKLNYKGNSVPIWIKSPFDNEKIYNVLAAVCVAVISGLNIVEISEKIKN